MNRRNIEGKKEFFELDDSAVADATKQVCEQIPFTRDRSGRKLRSGINQINSEQEIVFDADTLLNLAKELFEVSDTAWDVAKALEWLSKNGIRDGVEVRKIEGLLFIKKEALLKLSPNVYLYIRQEVRIFSVIIQEIYQRREFVGAPKILSMAIDISKNKESLLRGEVEKFVAGFAVDSAISAASGKAFELALKRLAIGSPVIAASIPGAPILIPLLGSVVVLFIVETLGSELADRSGLKDYIEEYLKKWFKEAKRNQIRNRQEWSRFLNMDPRYIPRLFGAPW